MADDVEVSRLAEVHIPLISICIANFNGDKTIEACIDSVLAQAVDCNVEILLHDDASTDDSAEFVARRYPSVILVRSKENVGFCVSNNRMAKLARGRYLLLLNNDAALLPDALCCLMDECRRLAQPAILTLPQYDAETKELLDIGCYLDPFLNPVPNRELRSKDVGTVHGACLWIDRELWEELGGFPEWFGSVAEDLYLCCKVRAMGKPVRALGRSGYLHHVGSSFGGGKVRSGRLATTIRRRSLSERNKTFIIFSAYPFPLMQVLLPLHLLLLLIEGLLLALLSFNFDCFLKIYLPIIPALWSRRTELKAERRIFKEGFNTSMARFFSTCDPVPYKLRMLLRHGLPLLR